MMPDRLTPSGVDGVKMHEEGWHVDPFGRHEARWISDGTPTRLVRDAGVVSKDPPPDTPFEGAIQLLPEGPGLAGSREVESETVRHSQGRDLTRYFDRIGWSGSNLT